MGKPHLEQGQIGGLKVPGLPSGWPLESDGNIGSRGMAITPGRQEEARLLASVNCSLGYRIRLIGLPGSPKVIPSYLCSEACVHKRCLCSARGLPSWCEYTVRYLQRGVRTPRPGAHHPGPLRPGPHGVSAVVRHKASEQGGRCGLSDPSQEYRLPAPELPPLPTAWISRSLHQGGSQPKARTYIPP